MFDVLLIDLKKKVKNVNKSNYDYETKKLNITLDVDVEKYLKLFIKYNKGQISLFATDTIEQMLKDLELDSSNVGTDYATGIKEATNESLDKIKQSLDTVKERVKKLVNDITESEAFNDMGEAEFQQAIKESLTTEFKGTIQNRVDTIARTTSNTASNSAKDFAIEKNDLTKQWIYTNEAQMPRDSHAAAHKQIADKDGNFKVGSHTTKYPSGFGIASEDINCHCTIIARKRK